MCAGALDRSGALAAFAVGTVTYGAGGWRKTLVLLAFFLPSVGLSRVGRRRKRALADIGKGGARDGWQVLANGGIATVCAVIASFAEHNAAAQRCWSAGFAGAYAAATADTWGTEIGTLLHRPPRSILTGRLVATGLSGGVTLYGTLAEIAGAVWIALCADMPAVDRTLPAASTRHNSVLAVTCGGIAGAFADSMLGATLQELRRCPRCDRTCETDPHACGERTSLVRGLRGFSNDAVNAAATLTGAGIALLLSARR